jgi:hypothetical protein
VTKTAEVELKVDECKPLIAGLFFAFESILQPAAQAGAYTRPLFGST